MIRPWKAAPGADAPLTTWSFPRSAPISSAPRSPAQPAEEADDEEQKERADEGDDHRADDRVTDDDDRPVERAGDEASEERRHDVAQESQVTPQRHPARQGAGDQAHQDPDDDLVQGQAQVDGHRRSVKHQGRRITPPYRPAPAAPLPKPG